MRDDSVRLKELMDACAFLEGCEVPQICHQAQKVLAMRRSIQIELAQRPKSEWQPLREQAQT